ncbi:hypothetical protein PISMIDRAFT_689832, partial [Pisolithus microcarpus 441]
LSRPDHDTTYEFQLKGAGRTPFSRSADGFAALPSSMLMHVSGIPTTRSPEMAVLLE